MKSTDQYLRQSYDDAYARERAREYPEVDALEARVGFAVDRARLESAARVLACPVKANAPNWQHGRVIYALAREYLSRRNAPVTFLDIGTAKGFSACAMSWAIEDAGLAGVARVESVDVVDPEAFVRRNSVIECETLFSVYKFVAPFIAKGVEVLFHGDGSAQWMIEAASVAQRVGFAFVDGKHSHDAVAFEAIMLPKLQMQGDVILFDDAQIKEVGRAFMQLKGYNRRIVELKVANRAYLHAVKC